MASSDAPRDLVVRSDLASDDNVVVSVADCGTGIAPGDLERIFEPFVTTKAQGMRLGLAVCRSIVKAHAGRLWAGNNPDGGATLRSELPAADALPDDN